MTLFKTKYCTLTYYPSDKLMHLTWHKQPDVKVLLSTYSKGIDLSIEHSATSWVADNRIGIHFDMSMQRMLAELTAKRLLETKVRRFARVVPFDVFHELVSHKIVHMVDQLVNNPIEFLVFTDVEDACEWARRQGPAQAIA